MAEKCQVCGGKVVNGRCSLCGMPYRNDDVLYHLNEPRAVHYKHASAKVRDLIRQYDQPGSKTVQRGGRADRNANGNRNTGNANRKNSRSGNVSRNTDRAAGKTQSAKNEKSGKSGGKGWIIWLIIGLLCAIPGLLDTIIDWISMNL